MFFTTCDKLDTRVADRKFLSDLLSEDIINKNTVQYFYQ